MKIIVCVKQVAAIDLQLELDTTRGVDPEDIINIVNPYDLVAVEEAVRIKEKVENSIVTLISLGPPSVRELLRKCLAMGADNAIHLWDRIFDQSDPWATSFILSKKISELDYDLILCGRKSIDQNNGQVGTFIAEQLGIAHVYGVTRLEYEENQKMMKVHRMYEGGDREVVLCPLPAVLSVDLELNIPRYPSLPDCLEALTKNIETVNAKSLKVSRRQAGRSGSLTRVVSFSLPKPRAKKLLKIDSALSAEERMKMLMSGGVKEKSGGEVLEGEPAEIAKRLVEMLGEFIITK